MKVKKGIKTILGIAAFMFIFLNVFPVLFKKTQRKIYKKSLKPDDIDFENEGPELIETDPKVEAEAAVDVDATNTETDTVTANTAEDENVANTTVDENETDTATKTGAANSSIVNIVID